MAKVNGGWVVLRRTADKGPIQPIEQCAQRLSIQSKSREATISNSAPTVAMK